MDLIFFLCVAALFVAYRNHSKNVQKGLLGAILMWYLYDEVNYVVANIILNSSTFTEYNNFWGRGYIYMSIATMVLFAALFINHFIINGDRHSRSVNVFVNQLLVVVIAVISIVSMIFQCFIFDGNIPSILEALSWHTGLATMGEIRTIKVYDENGAETTKKVCEFGITLDERIADGYYFAKSGKMIEYVLMHPELLEEPAGIKVEMPELR